MQRFVQYLASRNTLFNLSNFLDKSGLQGKSDFYFYVPSEIIILEMMGVNFDTFFFF